jgi:hypothetical protein
MKACLRFLATLSLLVASSCAMATEEPLYTVTRSYEAFELRRYEPYLVAETVVAANAEEAGNAGFRLLAGYIFGRNQGARKIEMTAPVAQSATQTATKIAMTAPVAQVAGTGGYAIQFALPREWTLATLPQPLDAAVTLRAMPARTLVVISYSGTWSLGHYAEQLQRLRDAMAAAGLSSQAAPVWARYDPPWTPWFLRRNEIWLEID